MNRIFSAKTGRFLRAAVSIFVFFASSALLGGCGDISSQQVEADVKAEFAKTDCTKNVYFSRWVADGGRFNQFNKLQTTKIANKLRQNNCLSYETYNKNDWTGLHGVVTWLNEKCGKGKKFKGNYSTIDFNVGSLSLDNILGVRKINPTQVDVDFIYSLQWGPTATIFDECSFKLGDERQTLQFKKDKTHLGGARFFKQKDGWKLVGLKMDGHYGVK